MNELKKIHELRVEIERQIVFISIASYVMTNFPVYVRLFFREYSFHDFQINGVAMRSI